MARNVKVVFRTDVRGIAQAGEVKTVSPGYARNYLFPRKLAFLATDAALKQWETERQGILAKAAHKREDAQSVAQKIEALTLTITARASDEGRLFGSVGRNEVAAAAEAQGVKLEKRDIELSEPIKHLGLANVLVRLDAGVNATLKVNVVAEEKQREAEPVEAQ